MDLNTSSRFPGRARLVMKAAIALCFCVATVLLIVSATTDRSAGMAKLAVRAAL